MLEIEKTVTPSPEQWEIVIEGMRNPKNSWDRIDSSYCEDCYGDCNDCDLYDYREGCPIDRYVLGPNDRDLANRLVGGGPVHAKFRRMLPVHVTINAPLYWWKEFDTYKVGTVTNSCSTMHKIHDKKFTTDDFSSDHLDEDAIDDLIRDITNLNSYRVLFLETKEKKWWWHMIQRLPTSYNQKRTVMLNYEALANMYQWRRNHKLDEWHTFCDWIEKLPYSELITGKEE